MLWRIISLISLIQYASCQLPIPPKPMGFIYKNGLATAGVQLDVFIDLLCPDSKQGYPPLQELTNHYEPDQFRLMFHLFPLPYHHNAFSCAQAAFTITQTLGDEAFIPWMEAMYKVQDKYWNEQTQHLGQYEVTKMLETLAMSTFPNLTKAAWNKGMSGHGGTNMDSLTRIAWKYACSRGVTGTPIYFINGIPFNGDSTWGLKHWIKIIDPLVQGNKNNEIKKENKKAMENKSIEELTQDRTIYFTSESCNGKGQPCEILPNRIMCCKSNESCTQGYGCSNKL